MKVSEVNEYSIRHISDSELLSLHRRMHQLIRRAKNREAILEAHEFIVEEMQRRGFSHSSPIGYMPVNPSHSAKEGMDYLSSEEVLSKFKDIIISEKFITLAGGVANNDGTYNDIDLFFRGEVIKNLPRIIMFRLGRGLGELANRMNFRSEEGCGPFTTHYPLYRLKLELISPLNKIYMQFQNKLEGKAARMAKASKTEDKIKPFRFFIPVKTSVSAFNAYRKGEYFIVDKVIDYINELGKPLVAVQKKYDGVNVEIHKKKDKVLIYTEAGQDITKRLPHLVKELQKIKHDFVVVAELEQWINGKHLGREIVAGNINEKSPEELHGLVANIHTLLWADGKDIHNEPLSYRLELAEDILPKLESLQPRKEAFEVKAGLVPTYWAENKKEIRDYITKVTEPPASEGAMIKIAEGKISRYPLTGITAGVLKFKKFAEVHAVVLTGKETKKKGIYTYTVGLIHSAELGEPKDVREINNLFIIPVCETYSTEIKAKPGEILTVQFHDLNHYIYKDGSYRIHLYEPSVVEKRLKKEEPDSASVAIRIAKEADIYSEKLRNYVPPQAPSDGKYRWQLQVHFRGKGVHADLRHDFGDPKHAWGVTLFNMEPGSIPESVDSLKDARKYLNDPKVWKFNPKTGEWKKRSKKPGEKESWVEIQCEFKKPEPLGWLEIGDIAFPPGGMGATRYEAGVFITVEDGKYEFGAQKPYFKEFFYYGKALNGRYLYRMLKLRGKTVWNFIRAIDQTPYVLGSRAVKEGWVPPYGFSALPEKIKKKVPPELKYWREKDKTKRAKLRDQLVGYFKEEQIKFANKEFTPVFQYLVWKGQFVKREGPSEQRWYLWVARKGNKVIGIEIEDYNILKRKQAPGTLVEYPKEVAEWRGVTKVPAGKYMNPNKELDATLITQSYEGRVIKFDKRELEVELIVGENKYLITGRSEIGNPEIWALKATRI